MVRRKSDKSRPRKSLAANQQKVKTNKTEVIVSKLRRSRNGVKALREIKYLRKSTQLLIPKLPFSRLVREIMIEIFPQNEIHRMQASALEALQESAEMYLVQFFEDSILLAYHCKRVTLMLRDMVLMRRLRGRDDVINR